MPGCLLDVSRHIGRSLDSWRLRSGSGSGAEFVGFRPGGVVEWLAARPGAGVAAFVFHMTARSRRGDGVLAIVDAARECYVPALAGWGVNASRVLLIRPSSAREEWWAIEQCLRCSGVWATWARVGLGIPTLVHRRWQMAAEVGGGVGLFFRPELARREPVWADARYLATPMVGGDGESRRLRIDVLYRRGGVGGASQVWEIDHAAGAVRLVPELADSAAVERAARA